MGMMHAIQNSLLSLIQGYSRAKTSFYIERMVIFRARPSVIFGTTQYLWSNSFNFPRAAKRWELLLNYMVACTGQGFGHDFVLPIISSDVNIFLFP